MVEQRINLLTLKCKLKCYVKPMKNPLGVSPSKGNQGTTRGKEKILFTSVGIEPTTSGLDLLLGCRLSYEVGQRKSGTFSSPTFSVSRQSNGRSHPEVVGSIPTEVKRFFFFTLCGSLIPFTRANAQWIFHAFHIAL